MNTTNIEKNWTAIKGQMKTKWTKFNDEELESVKSDLNQLTAKIQKTYGVEKSQAEQQFEEFKKSAQSLLGTEAPAKDAAKGADSNAPSSFTASKTEVSGAANPEKASKAV